MDILNKVSSQYTEFVAELSAISNLFESKQWHQLCLALESLLRNPSFLVGSELSLQFYVEFIRQFDSKLNEIQLVIVFSLIAKRLDSPHHRIEFYNKVLFGSKFLSEEGILCLKLHISLNYLSLKSSTEAINLVEDCGKVLPGLANCDSYSFSLFYKAKAELMKATGIYADFYTFSLLYLSYTNIVDLEPQERSSIAREIALASIVAESVFDFAKFLSSPIIDCLSLEDQWLKEIIHSLNVGDVSSLSSTIRANIHKINSHDLLKNCLNSIRTKGIYLAILNSVLRLHPHNRTVSFSQISSQCSVSNEEVEWILMRLMSLKLLKGEIDEFSQTAEISWIQPRELDALSIKNLSDQLQNWTNNVKTALQVIEENTPDLAF